MRDQKYIYGIGKWTLTQEALLIRMMITHLLEAELLPLPLPLGDRDERQRRTRWA